MPNWQGGVISSAFLIVFVVVICVRTSPDPPTHRSSFYVSSHVGTEICARQMLGNNICLHAPTVTTDHPYLSIRLVQTCLHSTPRCVPTWNSGKLLESCSFS